jgi:hypothetical protein
MRVGDEDCKACNGGAVPCKGGGNMRCWRRHKQAQHIALILDSYGGARTIVADRRSLKANVRPDELCHVVPGLLVHEPIAWGDIPFVIERARLEFEKWLDTRPNLTSEMHRAVTLYRLRQQRHPSSQESLNPFEIAET